MWVRFPAVPEIKPAPHLILTSDFSSKRHSKAKNVLGCLNKGNTGRQGKNPDMKPVITKYRLFEQPSKIYLLGIDILST